MVRKTRHAGRKGKMSATVEIRDGVGRIRMDDGKVNVLSKKMLDSVLGALEQVEAAKAIAVI
jgi:enoyl-CoA hydratase/carnithine racemase